MPANLPAEAKHKWNEVSLTKNPKRRLELLKEFLGLVPKHKGTSKLRARVKRQMALLRREISDSKKRKTGKSGPKIFFEKEGAAQIVLLGPTNVGRSSLLASLTNAKVEVSIFPLTTLTPVPGMFRFEDIQFQVIEAPALCEGSEEGDALALQSFAVARNADGLLLMVDLSRDPFEQLRFMLSELGKARIQIKKPSVRVEIERKQVGFGLRLHVLGQLVDCSFHDVESLLRSYRISDAKVKIFGGASLDDVEEAVYGSAVFRPTLVLANKSDLSNRVVEKVAGLQKIVDEKVKVHPISCKTGEGLHNLGVELFKTLDLIRVYTKEPGRRECSPKPFVLKKGDDVSTLSKYIHTDFYNRFLFAKVWSKSLPFSPQKVGLPFVLSDGDVIEIRTK